VAGDIDNAIICLEDGSRDKTPARAGARAKATAREEAMKNSLSRVVLASAVGSALEW